MKECRTVEWKESVSNSFLKTVSAFANYASGSIVFGIADDGSVKGLADTRAACLDIENKINDSIDPTPFFSLTENTRKKTVTLAVEEGLNKPYLYKGKAYRRSDTATVEVDNVELRRLVLAGQNMHFEELPCHEQDLTFRALEEKLEAEHVVKALNGDVLRTFNLFNFEAGFNNAALIVSDQNTFPGIDVARFGGNINTIADRATFEGMSAIEQIDGACTMFERYYSVETIEGARRTTHYSIPYEAFREAVANAVAHRTWDVNAKIRIAMHPNRIEISWPWARRISKGLHFAAAQPYSRQRTVQTQYHRNVRHRNRAYSQFICRIRAESRIRRKRKRRTSHASRDRREARFDQR